MCNIIVTGNTPPEMGQALADGALAVENARLREELKRVTDERDMLLWARARENEQKLAEAQEYYGRRPSLGSRICTALAMTICGIAAIGRGVSSALRRGHA